MITNLNIGLNILARENRKNINIGLNICTLNLLPILAEKFPTKFLSQIKKVDPSLRYRIFMDYIEDMNVGMLEFLLEEIEYQIRIKKCLTNKK